MSKRRSAVLRVEQLEDRSVPSTLVLPSHGLVGPPIVLPPGPITPPPLPAPPGHTPVAFPPITGTSPPGLVPHSTPTLPAFPGQRTVEFPSTVSLASMEWLASELANQFAQSQPGAGLQIQSTVKPTSSGGTVLAYNEQDRGNSLRINLTQQTTAQGQQSVKLSFTEKDGNATLQFTFSENITASGQFSEQFSFTEHSTSANSHFHLAKNGSLSGV
jgi:hypothetical protein